MVLDAIMSESDLLFLEPAYFEDDNVQPLRSTEELQFAIRRDALAL
jgi:hypothetical protein